MFSNLSLSIPCLFTLTTLIPGLNLLIVSALYFVVNICFFNWFKKIEKNYYSYYKKAAFRDEKYIPSKKKDHDHDRTINVIRPPERPPPRTLSDLNIRVNDE
jgi:hypothetical protein